MDRNRLLNLRYKTLLTVFIVIFIIGGARTYDDFKRNNEIINYKANEINKSIESNYFNRLNNIKRLISFNGELLSNSTIVKESIKKLDREALYNYSKEYYLLLKKVTKNNNIRIHYHLENHKSFLRVHKKDTFGDNLKDLRPIISQTIFEREQLSGFERGKHDINQMTYRMTFPIIEEDRLLAVLEIGIDFNSIIHDIEKDFEEQDKKIYIVSRIKEGMNNFHDFMDSGLNINRCLYKKSEETTPILEEYERVKSNQVKVDNRIYSLTFDKININTFDEEQIGSFVYIVDITKDLEQNRIFFYSSISKPILAVTILSIFIYFVFNFIFKQFSKIDKRTKNILNEQSSFIFLTDGEKLLDSNLTLLKFFGFTRLEDFREKYECICNTFVKKENYLQKYNNGVFWIDYLLENNQQLLKVCIKDLENNENIFTISIKKFIDDIKNTEIYYIGTLTNITDLEKTNLRLIEQSKQASLGEMLANIAHQWRQPLNAISVISSSIKLHQELGTLENKEISSSMDTILGKTAYLSETIDTFRNYLNAEKEKKELILQDGIDVALLIVNSVLKDSHINIINNIDYKNEIKVFIVPGELPQVIINIINNAKDVLIEKKILEPTIIVSTHLFKDKVVISIEDNGGGIPEEIKEKIFDPYFTTKHKTQGTGLGLHMSYKIIKESLNGDIYVKNSKLGAKFFIELPLIKESI